MKYGFYPGCAYHSAAGYKESTDSVNRALGITFEEISDWNCCGATVMFGEDELNALAIAGRNFALAQAKGYDEIVTGCNACYTTLRKAVKIFGDKPDYFDQINKRLEKEGLKMEGLVKIRHSLEVLANDVPEEAWSGRQSEKLGKIKVAAYYGCQLTRPWGDLDHPERPAILEKFIKKIGFSPVEHSAPTLCCGASHAVPYKKECQPLISRIIQEVKTKGADLVITVCPLCQFNLDDGQKGARVNPIPVPYFSQLAGLALGIKPEALGLDKLLVPIRGVINQIS